MTVIFAGGEDTSFIVGGSTSIRTSGGGFRAAFARLSFNTGAAPTSWPLTNYIATPAFSGMSSLWCHGRYSSVNAGNNNTTTNAILMALSDSSSVGRILVRATGSAGQLKISTRNAAGTIVDLVTSPLNAMPSAASGAPIPVDLFVNYGTSGQIALYVNGAVVADTGVGVNVTTDSATSLTQLWLGGMYTTSGEDWSEVLIQDNSTLGCSVQTLAPVAAGNTQSWLPNTVGNINPTTINDTNFVAATTSNSLSEWTVSTSLPTGNYSITAVVQEARVSVGTSGPQHFEWLVRTSDGSDNVTGSIAATTGFLNYRNIWATNPHTGAAWNAGELINAGIESLT